MGKYTINDIVQEPGVAYAASESSPEMQLVEMARHGISKKALLRIAEMSNLSISELTKLLPVSLRTIQRYSDDDLLDRAVSEHALNIAEVISHGTRVFGSLESFQRWLHSPLPALGNQTPVSFLDTGFGARMVSDLLGRIEHGVYS
jgi:putative toxin-antitoxin system antitoxin component (TIGR02293 family)